MPWSKRLCSDVTNWDLTPAEPEPGDFRVEKIALLGDEIAVMAGLLKAGAYRFIDEFCPNTIKGTITVLE